MQVASSRLLCHGSQTGSSVARWSRSLTWDASTVGGWGTSCAGFEGAAAGWFFLRFAIVISCWVGRARAGTVRVAGALNLVNLLAVKDLPLYNDSSIREVRTQDAG